MTRDYRNPFAPELTQGWECALHGHVETEVCHACFAAQQLRVERESHDLRYANTAEAIRRRVLAAGNGHGEIRDWRDEAAYRQNQGPRWDVRKGYVVE